MDINLSQKFSFYNQAKLYLAICFLILTLPVYGEQLSPPIPRAPGAEFRQLNQHLFEAAKKGYVKELKQYLEAGASVKARDRFGNTALLIAARANKIQSVKTLLKFESKINQQNLVGSSALLRAATAGRRKIAKFLVQKGAKVNLANNKGITPIIASAFNGDLKLLNFLIAKKGSVNAIDTTGKSAIVYAAARGDTEIVTRLLDIGIDPKVKYGNDLTALMWAAGFSDDVPESEGEQTVKVLLDRGAQVNNRDNRGWTALIIAAERGHVGVVNLLLGRGASRHLRAKDGKTAYTIARQSGHNAIAKLLKPKLN